jgi:voltage-gated potassium channel
MRTLKEANFLYLLIGLLSILIGAPIFVEFAAQPPALIIEIGFSVTLMFGIWSMIDSKKWFLAGLTMALAEPVITLIAYFMPAPFWDHLALLIAMAFCLLSLVFAVGALFRTLRMSLNDVCGAICIYLLLGILIAILNVFIYRLVPNSFKGLTPDGDPNQGLDLIYYSFVTMSTLGYGDIVPTGPIARAVAYLGAVTGQFYIAILVALVIGIFLTQQRADHE